MTITPGHLMRLMPKATMSNIEKYLPVFLKYKEEYYINTPLRVAAFWAQVAHESQYLSRVQENLNYSALGLLKTWPSRFNPVTARQCERNPEKIANKVYANRMGNGNEASGDGWRHRGAGLIQLTGKGIHLEYSKSTYGDDRIVKEPALLLEPEDAVRSAMWFWKSRKLNTFADAQNITLMTERINGGRIGLLERKVLYETALTIFI